MQPHLRTSLQAAQPDEKPHMLENSYLRQRSQGFDSWHLLNYKLYLKLCDVYA